MTKDEEVRVVFGTYNGYFVLRLTPSFLSGRSLGSWVSCRPTVQGPERKTECVESEPSRLRCWVFVVARVYLRRGVCD